MLLLRTKPPPLAKVWTQITKSYHLTLLKLLAFWPLTSTGLGTYSRANLFISYVLLSKSLNLMYLVLYQVKLMCSINKYTPCKKLVIILLGES